MRDTHTYCRAFGNGAVTTCSYDLGLSRLGLAVRQPTFRLRGERSYPLLHRRGDKHIRKSTWIINIRINEGIWVLLWNDHCSCEFNGRGFRYLSLPSKLRPHEHLSE